MKTNTLIQTLAVAGVLAVTGCSHHKQLAKAQDIAENTSPNSFTVSMTDSPGDFSSLSVEILMVEAYLDNRGWVILNDEPQFINVLDLTNGAQTTLAQTTEVSNGSYSKIRLTFGDENYIRFKPGVELAGIKLNEKGEAKLSLGDLHDAEIEINHDVNAQEGAQVLLDFNVAQSITQKANQCIMKPVITEIEDTSTGIQGNVDNSPGAAIILTDGVYTYGTYVNERGDFLLRGVDAGTYDLIVVPAGENPSKDDEHRMENITIKDGQITQIGSILF